MASEARIHAEGPSTDVVRQFTVADGTAISKGTLLVYGAATRTGLKHSTSNELPLGFVTEDKEASDGKTELGCQRTGVVDAVASEAVVTGDWLVPSGTANQLRRMATSPVALSYAELQFMIGRALSNAASGARVKVALMLG